MRRLDDRCSKLNAVDPDRLQGDVDAARFLGEGDRVFLDSLLVERLGRSDSVGVAFVSFRALVVAAFAAVLAYGVRSNASAGMVHA